MCLFYKPGSKKNYHTLDGVQDLRFQFKKGEMREEVPGAFLIPRKKEYKRLGSCRLFLSELTLFTKIQTSDSTDLPRGKEKGKSKKAFTFIRLLLVKVREVVDCGNGLNQAHIPYPQAPVYPADVNEKTW